MSATIMKQFHNFNFRSKLLLTYLLIALIPAVFVGAASYEATGRQMLRQTVSTQRVALNNAANSMRKRIEDVSLVSELTQYYYIKYMLSNKNDSDYENLLRVQQLKNNLMMLSSRFDIERLQVYFSDEIAFSDEGIYFFPLSALPSQMKALGLSGAPDAYSDKDYWLYRPLDSSRLKLETQDALRLVRTVKDLEGNRVIAGYFIDIGLSDIGRFSDEIAGALESGDETDSGLFDVDGNVLYLASAKEGGFYFPDSWPEELKNMIEGSRELEGFLYNKVFIPDTQWTLFSKIPLSAIRMQGIMVSGIALLAAGLSMAVAFLVSLIMSRALSRRVRRLSDAMGKLSSGFANQWDIQNLLVPIENDYSEDAGIRNHDEIDRLTQSYNLMIRRIETLMGEVVRHETAAEKQKISLLQAQIKPHFLYNVLASIKVFVAAGNADEANRIIQQLSIFYRAHLKPPDALLTLRRELQSVTAYLAIESSCNPRKLLWLNNINDEWGDFLIPHFTLQPIVENCIIHAMEIGERPLTVVLEANADGDSLLLTVRDDGCGMSAKQLETLRRQLADSSRISDDHFGVANVHARLRLLYGNGFGLSVESVYGRGTTVTVHVPLTL